MFNINSHWYAWKSFQKKSSTLYFLYREPLAGKFACRTASSVTTKSRLFVKVFAVSPQKCTPQVIQNKILHWSSFVQIKSRTPTLVCFSLLHRYFKGMSICSVLKFLLRWQLVVLMLSGIKDLINNEGCVFSS